MVRVLKNVLIVAFAALHAVVVPMHIASEHTHHVAHDVQSDGAHSHDNDHPHTHDVPVDNSHADLASSHIDLAHHSEIPHHHSEHDHNLADHSQYRSRVDNLCGALPATFPVLAAFAVPESDSSLDTYELPPIQVPRLSAASLRGPPFC